jgi:hypothetical protein
MIGQSQSGTGKTAAFALTMLSRVDFDNNTPQVRQLAFKETMLTPLGPLFGTIARVGSSNPSGRG